MKVLSVVQLKAIDGERYVCVRFSCGHENRFIRVEGRAAPRPGEHWACRICNARQRLGADDYLT